MVERDGKGRGWEEWESNGAERMVDGAQEEIWVWWVTVPTVSQPPSKAQSAFMGPHGLAAGILVWVDPLDSRDLLQRKERIIFCHEEASKTPHGSQNSHAGCSVHHIHTCTLPYWEEIGLGCKPS